MVVSGLYSFPVRCSIHTRTILETTIPYYGCTMDLAGKRWMRIASEDFSSRTMIGGMGGPLTRVVGDQMTASSIMESKMAKRNIANYTPYAVLIRPG